MLEGEDAVVRHREVMGATNPQEAAPGTIVRTLQLLSMKMQCMAQTLENAEIEINYFFGDGGVCPRTR